MSVPFHAKADAPVRVCQYVSYLIEELSRLIGKAPTTIRSCATNAKYLRLIPRPFKMPNSRQLCWWESDVLACRLTQVGNHRPLQPDARAAGR